MTKEIKAINDALQAYYDKYDGNVIINASVLALDENGDCVDDDHIWNAGCQSNQLINLECMMEGWKEQYK